MPTYGGNFCTRVDTPRCTRLKSAFERATDAYDGKVLRRHLRAAPRPRVATPPRRPAPRPGSPSAARRPAAEEVRVVALDEVQAELGDSTLWTQWAEEKAAQPSCLPDRACSVPQRGFFSDRVRADGDDDSGPLSGCADAADDLSLGSAGGALPTRPVSEWLHVSLHLARQAQAHETFTTELRGQTEALKRLTDSKAQERRKGTNGELRARVRSTEREKERIEKELAGVREEHCVLGHVKQFIAELRNMKETGPLAGCTMRIALRESRPKGEQVTDSVHTCLQREHAALKKAVDELESMVQQADAHLRRLAQAQTDLFEDLMDKVEWLRIDEQCLVLDGSTSQKPHMGGSAAFQPPLDIVLDAQAKTAIQGFDSAQEAAAAEEVQQRRPETRELLQACAQLVLRSVALRRQFKRQLVNMELRTRDFNKGVDAALRQKVRQQESLLGSLQTRVEGLRAERRRLEEQMHFVRAGLEEKNREKDIVCKRLRLRQQRPNQGGGRDKVQDALEAEYDTLQDAVHEFSGKLNHITLEVSRMHETLRLIESDAAAKRTAFLLDRQCLEQLPFAHTADFPHAIFNAICGGRSCVYGVLTTHDRQQGGGEADAKDEGSGRQRARAFDGAAALKRSPAQSQKSAAPARDGLSLRRTAAAADADRLRRQTRAH